MEFESVKPRVEFLKRADLPNINSEDDAHLVVEGTFQSTQEGKFGDYHTIKDAEGKYWGLPGSVVLDDKFSEVVKGDTVRVLYTGMGVSQATGKDYRVFEVLRGVMEQQELPLPKSASTVDELDLD